MTIIACDICRTPTDPIIIPIAESPENPMLCLNVNSVHFYEKRDSGFAGVFSSYNGILCKECFVKALVRHGIISQQKETK